jgi:hypothetical protein
VYEAPAVEGDMVLLRGIIRRCMETEVLHLAPLDVPLTVNMSVGRTLGNLRTVVV